MLNKIINKLTTKLDKYSNFSKYQKCLSQLFWMQRSAGYQHSKNKQLTDEAYLQVLRLFYLITKMRKILVKRYSSRLF